MSLFEQRLAKDKEVYEKAFRECCTSFEKVAPVIYEAMRYSLMAGGKRIRPLLCENSAHLFQKDTDEFLISLGCAIEMLHTYSLIHDDLPCMDNSDLRRGIPACHKKFSAGIATLAGDALLTLAWDYLIQKATQFSVKAPIVLEIIRILSASVGADGMIAGQVLDLEAEQRTCTLEELEKIHIHKTGKLFEGSILVGAIYADANPCEKQALSEYARHFGLVFQITDDILDVVGDVNLMGKSCGIDAANKKSTYVTLLGIDGARKKAKLHKDFAINAIKKLNKDTSFFEALVNYLLVRNS